ncbi:hypothetical protein [Streptodolium elevatio]
MAADGGADGGAPASTGEARKPRLGPWDTGAKVLHALGLATLLVSEYLRFYMDDVRAGRPVPNTVESALESAVAAARDGSFHRTFWDIQEDVSFGQERAALWAAVFFAVVVRRNNHGPTDLQTAISVVTAAYCAIAALAGSYLLSAGPPVLFALLFSFGAMFTVTRE